MNNEYLNSQNPVRTALNNENEMAEFIGESLWDVHGMNASLRVETGDEAGILTSDTMLVVKIDGKEFHITIQDSGR